MQIEYHAGSLNLVPDALCRFNEKDTTEAISTISESGETSDIWYKRILKPMEENPPAVGATTYQ